MDVPKERWKTEKDKAKEFASNFQTKTTPFYEASCLCKAHIAF